MTNPLNVTVHWGDSPDARTCAAFWLFSDAHTFAVATSTEYPDWDYCLTGPVAKGRTVSVYRAGVVVRSYELDHDGQPLDEEVPAC